MKKAITILIVLLQLTSCKSSGEKDYVLPTSTGNTNKILVVMKSTNWLSKPGDEIRTVFGEHQVGLPQDETLLSVSQIDPTGFKNFMRNHKAVLLFQKSDKNDISIVKNKYAEPQVIVVATFKNEEGMIDVIKNKGKEIMQIFKEEDIKFIQNIFKKEKVDPLSFEAIKKLNIDITIPSRYRFVDGNEDFIWLRQHLKSGIARGDGTNNVLIYSLPLTDESKVADNITAVRDSIGEKYLPGSKEGMYMITERAYTPFIYEAKIDGKEAYETRGKWEVKNDFMAGPFLNYTILDKKNNRIIVFEGFTYAPSVNKRDFLFELEAIGKSIKIKE